MIQASYGAWSLVPVLIVIILSVVTKRAFEPLFFGTVVACIIYSKEHFAAEWVSVLIDTAGDADNQWILLMCGLFGSLIALINKANGTNGFKKICMKLCTSEKRTRVVTFFLGVLIYIDDYLNMITVGTCMKSVYDEKKMQRKELAYIMNSTGTPVCVLLPFSTWAAFYCKLFLKENFASKIMGQSELKFYCSLIPFAFYPILVVAITFLFCIGVMPKIGRMKSGKAESCGGTDTENEDGNITDFIVPILTLIIGTIIAGDIFLAVFISILISLIWYLLRGKIAVPELGDTVLSGFCDMIPTLAIILMALMFANICNKLNMTVFIINIAKSHMTAATLPAIVFVIVSALSFATGSTWGLSTIVIPIILPLADHLGANPYLTLGAILSANAFGSHACFYSDATTLAASSAGLDNMSHALSQFPYAMIAATISLCLYIVVPMIAF